MNTVCDRDWTEDFEHENGEYMNTCCECKNTFTGHKRRFICKVCSTSQASDAVEVVATVEAYGGKWAGIHWGECIGSTEDPERQLMTVAQHQRILAAATHPADQLAEPDAELVELLRSKFPRIDPCQPVPLDEKAHCCEYTIYVERERLHRIIDAKLASLEVKP